MCRLNLLFMLLDVVLYLCENQFERFRRILHHTSFRVLLGHTDRRILSSLFVNEVLTYGPLYCSLTPYLVKECKESFVYSQEFTMVLVLLTALLQAESADSWCSTRGSRDI